jgi:hypothetical protein
VKINTQHVSLRQIVEDKVRGEGVRSGVERRERMKGVSGMKDRNERSLEGDGNPYD